jgi:SAM-dependent methyltransferase
LMSEFARPDRERESYDEHYSFECRNDRLHQALSHVRHSPNAQRALNLFDKLVEGGARGGDVLEIGCGDGWQCKRVLKLGARVVHGIDVSKRMLHLARAKETAQLRFFEHDVHQDWPEKYDLIFGRAVLHHVDYRAVLSKLYRHNLRPGGQMLFVEPLGENFILKCYWLFGKAFHTEDEAPFMRSDLEWMSKSFSSFMFYPLNYMSLPAGIISSFVFKNPDNFLLRLSDRIDAKLAKAVPYLAARYQSGIFHIQKPT